MKVVINLKNKSREINSQFWFPKNLSKLTKLQLGTYSYFCTTLSIDPLHVFMKFWSMGIMILQKLEQIKCEMR